MGKREKPAKKVVLDTNTLISALLFRGELSRIVDLWKNGSIIPLFSRETFGEFKTVLEYPKFSLTGQEIKLVIEDEVLPFFEIVEPIGATEGVCRDPDDDKFISCAASASADFIVTGDKDLLDLGKFGFVEIINASLLLNMFDIREE
jgi:putative PIN family toxin of toxin-antitoxin system